jgi:hypothetical protein
MWFYSEKTSGHKKKVMVGDYNDKGGASRYFFNVKSSGGTEDFFIYKENNIIIWNIKSLDTQEYNTEENIEVINNKNK